MNDLDWIRIGSSSAYLNQSVSKPPDFSRRQKLYSMCKFFTGFSRHALIVWELIVKMAIKNVIAPPRIKVPMFNVIRNAKLPNHHTIIQELE